ncbi:MAG: RNA polymerase sigma factor [Candidatus Omnitrophica bacterium]|nr:RNA polymerase sigma factor [Candidatus Omnitrophota bacterium]
MPEKSEATIRQAASGDITAFEEIYRTWSGYVYNVILRIVGYREDADEVTQEVFLTVYRQLKYFRFQSSFKTWVYRVAVNAALNRVKKTSKERSQMVAYDENLTPVAAEPEAEKRAQQEYLEQKAKDILDKLNPDQRACVVLRNIEGLSYQEIAAALKININTVRTRLLRARETLLRLKDGGLNYEM